MSAEHHARMAADKFGEARDAASDHDVAKLAEGLRELADAVKALADEQKNLESRLGYLIQARQR